MRKIYELDEYMAWTGRSREVEPHEGRPIGWVIQEPPLVPLNKKAYFVDGAWQVSESPPESVMAGIRKERLARLAQARYEAEVSGVIIDGIRVPTDDRSKSLISGKAVSAMIALQAGDEHWSTRWKMGDDWVSLNAEQFLAIAKVVDGYVQGCFDREAELSEKIKGGENPGLTGWPSNMFSVG